MTMAGTSLFRAMSLDIARKSWRSTSKGIHLSLKVFWLLSITLHIIIIPYIFWRFRWAQGEARRANNPSYIPSFGHSSGWHRKGLSPMQCGWKGYFWFFISFEVINGWFRVSVYTFLNFSLLLIEKPEEGFGRLLTPLQPLSLTPLNRKFFDFQGYPLWFFIAFKNVHTDNPEVP